MTPFSSLLRPVRQTALCLVPLILVACEDGTQGAAPSSTPTATDQTAAAAAPSTAGAPQGENQIRIAKCAEPIGNEVYFRVAESRLKVPGNVVVDAIPANMKPPLKQETVAAELQRQAAQGSGCPEKPLETMLLVVKDELEHPLLEGTIGLIRPSNDVNQQFARLTRQLQASPTENCRELNGELLQCVGTETRGATETTVMYVITTDRTQNLSTGGPLAIRCVLQEKQIRGCNLIDEIAGNLVIDVTLNAGNYSTADLSGARTAALNKVRAYQN
jgi:hypothetical protein